MSIFYYFKNKQGTLSKLEDEEGVYEWIWRNYKRANRETQNNSVSCYKRQQSNIMQNIKDKKGSKLINVKEIDTVKNIIEIPENLNQNSPPINLNVKQKIQTIKKIKKYRGFKW